MVVRVIVVLKRTVVVDSDVSTTCVVVIFRVKDEDCRNVSHCQQQSYSGLRSTGCVNIDLPADETSCWSSSSSSSHTTGSVSIRCSLSMTVPALAITEKGQWVRLEI